MMGAINNLQAYIDGIIEERDDLRTQLAEEKEMNLRWKKAVEGLTPTGSEFVNDPERCAAFIRDRTRWPKQIIEARKKLAEAEERAGRMEEEHDMLLNRIAELKDAQPMTEDEKRLEKLLTETAGEEGEPLNGMEMTLACEEWLKKSYHPGQEEHTHE